MKNRCKENPCCGDPTNCTGGTDILPCPFCGGHPEFHQAMSRMICQSCPAMMDADVHPGIHRTWLAQNAAQRQKAIKLWNRRTPAPLQKGS